MDLKKIEEKWQRRWIEAKIFETNPNTGREKFFITVAYPYPNMPHHVGHGRTFTLADVYARFKRMQGYNVLFPMAFHYTGTPILAIAKRLASGEKELIDDFLNVYKVPKEVLETFTDPLKIANYFRDEQKEGMKEIGYSIDWRREFTTIDPPYSCFIEWQFRRLQSKGLITRGSHPVGWCQGCENPMGQHDTKGDVEPEMGELTLIKFKFNDVCVPTGTLQSETIFGVTNIWVRPDIEYVKINVDSEKWIVSQECADKLVLLEHKVSVLGKVRGDELVGKYVENPATGEMIPVLPASFVDPKNATGIVMSVPAHAPYDYIALEDLKKDEKRLSEFDLKPEIISKIKPISLIYLEGYSQFPAVDAITRLGIKGQMDVKIEEATKEIYGRELRNGQMKENTGKYAGMSVAEAREKIEEELLRNKKADLMYELLNRPVYCRCGSEVVVKIFKDQWFINYGETEWKALAHECLDEMRIFPEDMRVEFKNVINWLREKACARKQGLGTKLPWDSQWIIESLSDSVIYMSYYTIARQIKEYNINAEKLNDEVFNYIFLGLGDPQIIGEKNAINPSLLREMRDEFIYFYPLNSRHSGRDLVPNHLTYFIFNHVAIFPKELWPRQIVVNGSVLMEGKKMSKSLGNVIPLRDALKSYGADPLRVAVLATAELLQDADFSNILAKSLAERLEHFFSYALQITDMNGNTWEKPLRAIDLWLLSHLQQRIKAVTVAMESLRFREAIHNALYMFDQDIQWYIRRSHAEEDKESPTILKQALEIRTLLLAPFAPHLCEELWEKMGKPPFISTAKWPSYDEAKIDIKVIEGEELVKTLRDDLLNIIQATKTTPKKIFFYTASRWKWEIYMETLKLAVEGQANVNNLMKRLMADTELKKYARQVLAFAQKTVADINKMPKDLIENHLKIGVLDEIEIMIKTKGFYSQEFNAEITIIAEDDADRYDPKDRSKLAGPYRPAIYIE